MAVVLNVCQALIKFFVAVIASLAARIATKAETKLIITGVKDEITEIPVPKILNKV